MKKYLLKKKEISNIKEYFIALYWILEQLFESQRTKIEFKMGYNLYAYFGKTVYRINKLFVSLEKILQSENLEKTKKQIKKKEKEFEETMSKYVYFEEYTKEHKKYFVARVLGEHCENLLDNENFNEEILQNFLSILGENFYFYAKIIDRYGRFIYKKKVFYKEKAITKRLKKNKWKNLKIT